MTLSHLLIIIFVQLAQLEGVLDLTNSTKAKLTHETSLVTQ